MRRTLAETVDVLCDEWLAHDWHPVGVGPDASKPLPKIGVTDTLIPRVGRSPEWPGE